MVANKVGKGPPFVPVMTSTEWLFGESLTAQRIRARDWSTTPLGARDAWPPPLRNVLNVVTASRVPMIVLWGRELVMLHNDACFEVFAERAETALGGLAPIIWRDAWPSTESDVQAVMTRGESLYRENVRIPLFRHGQVADGFFTSAYTPICMDDGTVGGVLVIFQETTAAVEHLQQLEHTQETLRASQAYLEAAFANMGDGIVIFDKNGRLVGCNDAFASICQFPDKAQCAQTFAEYPNLFAVFYPDGRPVPMEELAVPRALRGEKITNAKYIFRRKDTGYEWLGSYSFAPIFDSAGQIVASVVSGRDITAEDKAAQALRASEAKYAAIFEKSPYALAIANSPGGIFTAVNDAFLRMLEYTREEVLGKSSADLGIADDESWQLAQADLQRHGAVRSLECVLYTKNRRKVHVSLSQNWIDVGNTAHVLVTMKDLTARKEAEEARRLYRETQIAEQASKAAEAKYRGIISVSADAIVVIDERQEIVEWNLGAETIFGYSRSEIIGKPSSVVIPPQNRGNHQVHVEHFARETGSSRKMDHSGAFGLRKSGEQFPISATISRLRLGTQLLMTAAVRDISEEKRREEELRILADIGAALSSLDFDQALSNVLHTVVQSLGNSSALFLLDGDTPERLRIIMSANRDPMISDRERSVHGTVFQPDSSHPIWSIIQNRQGAIIEPTDALYTALAPVPISKKLFEDSKPRSIMAVPLVVSGRSIGALRIATPDRDYDARDLRLLEQIGRRIALFVENARLHQSEQSAIRMRDEVLGIVAHDLRNPLGVILLEAAKILRASDVNERVTKAMTSVDRSARRMHRIIEDLLDFVSFDSGQLSMDLSDESPARLLTDAADAQAPLYDRSGLPLEIHTYPGLPTISIDRHRILQVFQNLLGNALKFSTAGQKVILGAKQDQENKSLLFWVQDHGGGIDADDLPRVFDRFFHGDTRRGGGTGLGLAIVKKIIEMHGGRVWVESEVGRGSTFYFTIPLKGAHAAKG